MPHAHDHRDHHDHAHGGANFGTAFAAATVLNLGLVAAQIFYGLAANSVALLADAGHNFGDALGLVLAWGGYVLSRAAPTERFTYGFRSASILSALINAILLLVATGAIAWEAILRLVVRRRRTDCWSWRSPAPKSSSMACRLAADGGAGARSEYPQRFRHLAADAGVSAGVVIAGAVLLVTRWTWVDPVASLLISVAIVWGTWGLLRESLQMSMDAVPQGISITDVRGYLENLPGVADVHDLHIWAMSTTETALTVHLVCHGGRAGDAFLMDAVHELDRRFGIHHATIQIEAGELECRLAPTNVV